MRPIAIILLICYQVVVFRMLIPVADYLINQEYIASELCENKEQPVLACNGKCYLMSEITKIYGGDEDQSNNVQEDLEEDWSHSFLSKTQIEGNFTLVSASASKFKLIWNSRSINPPNPPPPLRFA